MSLFDDFSRYESSTVLGSTVSTSSTEVSDAPIESGYVSILPTIEEEPMFKLSQVKYKPPASILHVVVSNNVLCMGLSNNHVLRIDLNKPQDVLDTEVSKRSEDSIYKIFLDPSGRHLIVTFLNGENIYLHESSFKKPRSLSKFKGVVIESVAWNKTKPGELSTREILVGTTKGLIIETEIEPTEDALFMKKSEEKYYKVVYKIEDTSETTKKDIGVPITGLKFEPFPASSKKYAIVATTETRMYQFVGNVGPQPIFDQIFAQYMTNPSFVELPGQMATSEFHFYSQFGGLPRYFGWMTGPGVYHGSVTFGSQDKIIDSPTLLNYPNYTSATGELLLPISMALTEFHFIFLYNDRIVAVSKLSQEPVLEEEFKPKTKQATKLAFDQESQTYWAYTPNSIFELVVTKEDRHVWELYLAKNQFDAALQYCKDPSQKDKVLTAQADYFFSQKRYQLAAAGYAQTQKSFEEVTLKLINEGENEALKIYLLKKLESLKPQDATQCTLISTWLVEIYLDQLNTLKDTQSKTTTYNEVKEDFLAFLQRYKDHLNPSTTYTLISSHGRIEEMLEYAKMIEDYERVITYYIQQGQHAKALSTMNRKVSNETWIKFAPVIIEYAPADLVDALVRTGVDPKGVIPALMKYDISKNPPGDKTNYAIKYLESCIFFRGNRDPTVCNFLLTLYAQQEDDKPLQSFLLNRDLEDAVDLQYALRLCTQLNKTKACILIYSSLNLYEEAVELALKTKNIDMAKENAEKPDDDDALRKKLWLKIAKHVVEGEKDVKKAMSVLKECPLLKIEDVLPFFSDFVLIDDFKEEISLALEEYNQHIQDLKEEMDDATKTAESIRDDIRELRNKFGIVSASSKCNVCSYSLMTRQFYLFPCQHVFHSDCLINNVTKNFNAAQRQKYIEIQEKLAKESTKIGRAHV